MTVERRAAKVPLMQRAPGAHGPGLFLESTASPPRQPTQSLLVQMYARMGFGDGALPFKLGSLCGRSG